MINEIIEFLESKNDKLIDNLKEKMYMASKNQDYEKAIIYRDKIMGMQEMLEKQKIVSTNIADRDFLAIKQGENISCIFMFFVRGGKVVGTENFIFEKENNGSSEDIISSFLKQYYINAGYIPKEIYINQIFDDLDILSKVLTKKKGSVVNIKIPQKGDKKDMIELVSQNAFETIARREAVKKSEIQKTLELSLELKELLNLDIDVRKIESYDISNIQGVDSVGGQVVFIDGKKIPKLYRRYKIKTVEGANDYASMEEIISRRIKHEDLPDLILLDGGKGQVSVIRNLFERENINIPVFGMYKDDKHKTMGLCSDKELFELKKQTRLYTFISSIQEEVHRFAIDCHHSRNHVPP